MEYRLLEKTELYIRPLHLTGADLGACAEAVAFALELRPQDVVVTDAIEDHLILDVLVPTVQATQIIAKRKTLLNALAAVPGVHITDETEVHSDGILGLISLDEDSAQEVMERSRTMQSQIAEAVRRRVMVFATGQEVLAGQVRDTNTPFLTESLRSEGYRVMNGQVLRDCVESIAGAFRQTAEEGYGLLITTGGVGAENKDQTIEALARVDTRAERPYILKFQKGQGRHDKDGVRIGVGVLNQTLIVCLPGPHDEVRLAWPVLKDGIRANLDKKNLARNLAEVLRHKFIAQHAGQL